MNLFMCEVTLILLIVYGSINSIVMRRVHGRVKGLESREEKKEERSREYYL
jgi:hypothetical protein